MLRAVFFAFLLLALLGDVRVFLFVINRIVFGSHRQEKSRWHWLLYVTPPLLLVLTALFWPVSQWIERMMEWPVIERITPERLEEIAWSLALAKVGTAWLIIAAGIGSYWILERIRVTLIGDPPLAGIRPLPSESGAVYGLEITHNELFIDGLPEAFDGYRIVFLTDTHVAPFVRPEYHADILRQVGKIDPDLILLGGDLYFHSTGYKAFFDLQGSPGSSTYVYGDIATDELVLGGTAEIDMQLNNNQMVTSVKAALLQ